MEASIRPGLSVREENKPGVLSRVTDAIAQEGISIKGFSAPSNGEHGSIRVYTEDPEGARTALEKFDFDVREEEYIVVDLPDETGKLSKLTTPISEERIDIITAFSTVRGDQAKIIFQTSANRKALELIQEQF